MQIINDPDLHYNLCQICIESPLFVVGIRQKSKAANYGDDYLYFLQKGRFDLSGRPDAYRVIMPCKRESQNF